MPKPVSFAGIDNKIERFGTLLAQREEFKKPGVRKKAKKLPWW